MIEELFSDTGLLNEDVTFHRGINIILGAYSRDRQESGINGIGKSTLIRLIDYALLSDDANRTFSQENYNFLWEENHTISLKLKIRGQSCYIRRSFGKQKEVVAFGTSARLMTDYDVSEMRQLLLREIFPIADEKIRYEGERFRTLMNFFVKDDIDHQHRTDPMDFFPYNAGKNEVIAYNFFLLGLPNSAQLVYSDQIKSYREISATVKSLRERVQEETGKKVEEFKSERIVIENRIDLLERSLKEYKFLEVYKDVENRLADITKQINDKLTSYYTLTKKLKRVQALFNLNDDDTAVDLDGMYEELTTTFTGLVKKTLGEMVEFRQCLVENRIRYNLDREKSLREAIENSEASITALEEQRASLLKQLDEKGELDVIANTYRNLLTEQTALARHVQLLEEIDRCNEKLQELDVKISELKVQIYQDLKLAQNTVDRLRSLFREIIDNALLLNEGAGSSAYFDVSLVSNRRRNQLPFDITIEIPKEKAQGRFMLKLVAYDLMVFLNAIKSERELPRFLIHDGVFHGTSKRTMTDTLNYVHKQSLRSPSFQYIVTFNEDEVYIPADREILDGKFNFDFNKDVVAKYTDSPDGMIFGRVFS